MIDYMKKTIYSFALIAIAAIGLSGCSDYLDKSRLTATQMRQTGLLKRPSRLSLGSSTAI